MRGILFFFTLFDWLIIPRHIINALWRGVNWRKATAKDAIQAAVLGGRSFFVQDIGQWSGANTFALLKQHGVTAYNFAPTRTGYHFSVRPQQAEYAAYILTRYGCPLDFDPRFL